MTQINFTPFESHLDENQALRAVQNATQGGEDGELFLEQRRSEALVFEDGRLKTASYDASEGFGLRAVHGGVIGYAHASEISQSALDRAVATARLAVGQGGAHYAVGPAPAPAPLYTDADPIHGMVFADKVRLLQEIDAYARDLDPRVIQATISLGCSLQSIEILRPDGLRVADTRPMVSLSLTVLLDENGRRESGTASGGGRITLDGVIDPADWQAKAREALRLAHVNLAADPAPAGAFDVVLGPGWPGILLHEAVGHGLEGDANRKGTSAFAGRMGERVASPGVTVYDDGTLPDRRGSLTIDDEGTPTQKTTLIEDGILVGYMQDRQNARLMDTAPTGNGRRESYAHAPMPRMTNTYMDAGDTAPKDLVASMKDGIYAVGFGGGQVDITNGKFVFSCTEAYRVQNGQIGAALKGATLIGDGATAMTQIRGLGNDMALDPGMGTCGKAGQWVPVGVGQPTVLIGGLTVGGAQT